MDMYDILNKFLTDNGVYDEFNTYIHGKYGKPFKEVVHCIKYASDWLTVYVPWSDMLSGSSKWCRLHEIWSDSVISLNKDTMSLSHPPMKRLPCNKKMYSETNQNNIANLKDILPNFYLSSDSEAYILDNLDTRSHELKQGDNILNLDDDLRAIYKIEKNEFNDVGYKNYIYLIKSTFNIKETYKGCLCVSCRGNAEVYNKYKYLLDYTVYNTCKVEVNGQQVKLFKHLKKLGVSQPQIELITTSKTGNDMYFVISRNPIDYLFASTNQSYSSCIDLESNYEGAYYMGLPATFTDKNRFMCFITNGKLKKYTIKGHEFKHFNVTVRAWSFFNDLNSVFVDKSYPHSGDTDFSILIKELTGLISYSSEYSLFNSNCIRNCNGDNIHIYLDNIGIDFDYLDNTYSYSNSGIFEAGYGGNAYEYTGGFEAIESLESLSEGNYCTECESNCTGEMYTVNGNMICEDCLNEYYFYCEDCNEYHGNDYSISINDSYWVCQGCASNNYLYCDECDTYHFNEDVYVTDNGVYCQSCYEDNYIWCDMCEEDIHIDYYNNNHDCCDNCFSSNYSECSECTEEVKNDELTDGMCNECYEQSQIEEVA